MNLIKLLSNPDYFPHGSDVFKSCPINNLVFYKKFKNKNKCIINFLKTILILKKFKNYHFTPKILFYNYKLELYTTNCGKLLQIKNLPDDWEEQLLNVKYKCLKHSICIKDWGLWEVNPFICNNLTLKNNKIYFIDLGDTINSNEEYTNYYFDKKIRSIKLILYYGYFYLFFHYINRIRIGFILLHPLYKLFLFLFFLYFI
jgi:hypothetical protein